MAIKPEKVNFNNISEVTNGGGISADHINSPLKASAYAQALATNQPNITEADKIGTVSVSIEEVDGTPRFVFKNLKGKDHSAEIKKLEKDTQTNANNISQNTIDIEKNKTDIKKNKNSIQENNVDISILKTGIETNTNSINFLTSLAEQKFQIVKATVHNDTFAERETADGLNVVDNSTATIEQIKGKSVATPEGFKHCNIKEIRSIGRNLFNSQNVSTYVDTVGATVTIGTYKLTVTNPSGVQDIVFGFKNLNLLSNKTYTLSFKKPSNLLSEIPVTVYFFDSLDNQIGNIQLGTNGVTFTTPASWSSVWIELELYLNNSTAQTTVIDELMLNYGDMALPFDTYREVGKLSIGKYVGDYVELKEYDTIRFSSDTISKQTSEVVFTGAETFEGLTNSTFDGCALALPAQHFEHNINMWGEGLCNHLAQPNEAIFSSWINATENCFKVQNGKIYLIFVEKSVSEAKAYITEMYNAGTPIVVVYKAKDYQHETRAMTDNYIVAKHGSEIVIQGDIDNSKYVANPTITATYFVEGEE